MRRALIVGINHYPEHPLTASINDARRMDQLLKEHEDESPNFDCQLFVSSEDPAKAQVTQKFLRMKLLELFANEADVVLFYFSGHGVKTELSTCLAAQDYQPYHEGISMIELMTMANQSRAREVIIILDCCHSDDVGNSPYAENNITMIRDGVSIITSSRNYQVSKATKGQFSTLTKFICQALEGGGADLQGHVNITRVYNYAETVLSSWQQRPSLKTYRSSGVTLREVDPPIPVKRLRLITKYFKKPDDFLQLDPEYEHTVEPRVAEKEEIMADLQMYRNSGLLVPVSHDHLYYAAMHAGKCKLTALGKYYWERVSNKNI